MRCPSISGRFFYRLPIFLFRIVDADFALHVLWVIRRIGIMGHSILVHIFIDLGREWGDKRQLEC